MRARQIVQSPQWIGDDDESGIWKAAAVLAEPSFANDGGQGALFQSGADEVMAVCMCTLQSPEEVTSMKQAAVNARWA
jgi:hypothetical protein